MTLGCSDNFAAASNPSAASSFPSSWSSDDPEQGLVRENHFCIICKVRKHAVHVVLIVSDRLALLLQAFYLLIQYPVLLLH